MEFVVHYPKAAEKQWKKLLRSPLFAEIYYYIEENSGCILRDLKKAMVDKNLERTLDSMIALGIVERENRRYSLLMTPKTECSLDVTLPDLDKERFSKSAWTLGIFSYLEKHPLDFEEAFFVAKGSELDNRLGILPLAQHLKEEKGILNFHALSDYAQSKLTIANYFDRLDKGKELSAEQEKIYGLLGDASPDYSLRAFGLWLLRLLEKDSFKNTRKDIFLEALLELKMLQRVEENRYALAIPFLEKDESTQQVEAYLEELTLGKSNIECLELLRLLIESLDDQIHPHFLTISEED